MNKMKSFVKQFVAVVTGDSAEAQAQKALRQADNSLKSHISALNFETMAFEETLEKAQEAEVLATINGGKLIDSKERYVRSLLDAKNTVTLAEEALKTHKDKIAFLQSKLDDLSKEVDSVEKKG